MIRRAKVKDIPLLVSLARKFMEETDWGWTFDETKSEESFYNYIVGEETEVLLSDSGFAQLAFDYEHSVEKIGYIAKFYIAPEGRGTEAARKLLESCVAWFDYHGCAHSFATSTANINQGNAFKNLMAKYGYRGCGDTLVRGLNE